MLAAVSHELLERALGVAVLAYDDELPWLRPAFGIDNDDRAFGERRRAARVPSEQVPEALRKSKIIDSMRVGETILERELELPFAPYPGLILWIGKVGEPLQDEAEVEQVFYNDATKTFLCKVKPRILAGLAFEQLAENYIEAGWHLQRQ